MDAVEPPGRLVGTCGECGGLYVPDLHPDRCPHCHAPHNAPAPLKPALVIDREAMATDEALAELRAALARLAADPKWAGRVIVLPPPRESPEG